MACDCNCSLQLNLCGVPYEIPADANGRIPVSMSPVIYDYDSADINEPLAANATQVVNLTTGVAEIVKFARDTVSGQLTHLAVCGTWVNLGGTGGIGGVDTVTYDLSSWTFPTDYANAFGEWTVAAADRMSIDDCPNETLMLTVQSAERADNFSESAGTPAPAGMETTAVWANYPTAVGIGGQILADLANPDPSERDAVRMVMDYPTPGSRFFTFHDTVFEFDYLAPAGGNIGIGLWYPFGGGQWAPLTGATAPPQAVTTLHADHLQIFGAAGDPVGHYEISYDAGSVPSREITEVVFFGVNNSNNPENFGGFNLRSIADVTGACFTWNTVAELAAWMTLRNPYGATFTAVGNIVSGLVPAGNGVQFGNLQGDTAPGVLPVVT